MKTLAIILILAFAAPVFASDLGLISIMESNGQTIPLYFTPVKQVIEYKPVKHQNDQAFNFNKFLWWVEILATPNILPGP